MSAALPVLTNEIGIEGIPAQDGVEYLHCETADDYIFAIQKLASDVDLQKQIGKNAQKFVQNAFDYEHDSYL